jgi:DNA-binding NarL/FixJ family response regulator
MAAEGVAASDIAQALFVTRHTVQTTLASVGERLGTTSPAELREALASLRVAGNRS